MHVDETHTRTLQVPPVVPRSICASLHVVDNFTRRRSIPVDSAARSDRVPADGGRRFRCGTGNTHQRRGGQK